MEETLKQPGRWPNEPGFAREGEQEKRLTPVLLSERAINGWVVLMLWVAPQLVLLAVNWQAWDLAHGDMTPAQRSHALNLFAGEMMSLAAGVGMAAYLAMRRVGMARWMGLVPMATGLLYLGMVFFLTDETVPQELTDWMLPPAVWIFKQFALVMPAALLGGFRWLCPNREGLYRALPGMLGSLLMAVGLLGGAIGFLPLMGWILGGLGLVEAPWAAAVFLSVFLALSVLAAASLLRLAVSLYVWARARTPIGLGILTFLVAVAGPLGGLVLNAWIPFPFDFQYTPLYVMAAINGLVLMLPNFAQPWAHRLVWVAQCALFPFTVYFFLVFVPFLPLGPLAILALFAGILMYVPLFLFALHGYRLWDGYRVEAQRGSKWLAAALGLVAVVAWPVGYTVQARWDKANLNEALDYVQYPNYSTNERFMGNRWALHSALLHLRDFKQGLYLPLVTEYYNWLAFDNLVLPQPELERLYQTFFGAALPASTMRSNPDIFSMGRGQTRRSSVTEVLSTPAGRRPEASGRLDKIEATAHVEKDAVRVNAALTLVNTGTTVSEYLGTISVPPGVAVSGFWLTIGTERVPGKIFEKRAAMWVYQKITEVRPVARDPALLRYTGPGRLELSVYPVAVGEARKVEVEFLYPQGMKPEIRIGDQAVAVPPPEGTAAARVVLAEDGNFTAAIPVAVAESAPSLQREPYLHIVVDASKGSEFREEATRQMAIAGVLAQFPEVKAMRLTFANYEREDYRDGAMFPTSDIAQGSVRWAAERFRGGFEADRAVKAILWQHHLQLSKPETESLRHFPEIVVLASGGYTLPEDRGNLAEFARFLPDQPGFWLVRGKGKQYVPLDQSNPQPGTHAVRIFQAAGQRFAAAVGAGAAHTSIHPSPQKPTGIECYEAATGQFTPLTTVVGGGDFVKAIAPWTIELGRIFEPYRRMEGSLGSLLQACRTSGVLVPSAAYMVVENRAQWKILEKTEQKTLGGHEALQLEETTPEPATLGMLAVGLAVLVFWFRGRRALSKWTGRFG